MKKDKKVTDKASTPNQKNDGKSSPPKTNAGKRRTTENRIEVGLFTKELQISEEDRPEFEAECNRLSEEYAPKTALRRDVLDLIACFAWRFKMELRTQETPQQKPQVEAGGGDTILLEQWYYADHRSLQAGLRFLRALRAEVDHDGLLHLEQDGPWKKSLIASFGSKFYDCLMEWKGMSPEMVQLAEHLEYMMTAFRMKPPVGLLPPTDPGPGSRENRQLPKVVPDPKLLHQMQLKLIDVQIEHLETLVRSARQVSGETLRALLEFSSRSFADAHADLQRAIELFLKVKKEGL